jgi:Flp pilus assembly protein CpaB
MQSKKRSPLAAIVLAVVIGLLVIALLNGVIRPTQVVVARQAIAPGVILNDVLLELRTIPMGARPADALTSLEEARGKMLAVGRAPGDLIVTSVLGEIAGAGIPAELPEGHVALAVRVTLASGVAGLLRPGQTVTLIGMLPPDVLRDNLASGYAFAALPTTYALTQVAPVVDPLAANTTPQLTATATPTPMPPSAPVARLALSGLRVLMVPQSFRYEEVPAGASEEQLFASARSGMSAQEGSVIVLDVPTALVEALPGYQISPAALLAALDQYGTIHLALEPAAGLQLEMGDTLTLNLGEFYNELNADRE